MINKIERVKNQLIKTSSQAKIGPNYNFIRSEHRRKFMKLWDNISTYWRAQILCWLLISLVTIIERNLLYHSLNRAIVITFFSTPIMLVLSELLRWIYKRTALHRGIDLVSTCVIATCAVFAGLISTLAVFYILQINHWLIPGWSQLERIAIPFVQNGLVFIGWSLAYFWISAEIEKKQQSERISNIEAERLKAVLQTLRLQLNPHFLFNALNGVIEEIPENPSIALKMLMNLTKYLRHSLNNIDQTIVDVETEIDAIKTYLDIQKSRFDSRLNCRVSVAPDASVRPIVSFLLQPLVENAIKHGNSDKTMNLNIDIAASGSVLVIEINNTGILKLDNSQNDECSHLGLVNLRKRLALYYPDRHHFSLIQAENDQVRASLILENYPCSGS